MQSTCGSMAVSSRDMPTTAVARQLKVAHPLLRKLLVPRLSERTTVTVTMIQQRQAPRTLIFSFSFILKRSLKEANDLSNERRRELSAKMCKPAFDI